MSRLFRSSVLALVFGSLGLGLSAASPVKPYGAKVRFKRTQPLRFSDFTLEYLGRRRVSSKLYPRGFLNHDFAVSAGSERVTVTWSAGTGDVGPAPFKVGGRDFVLELVRSDSLGRLEPDQLVITMRQPGSK